MKATIWHNPKCSTSRKTLDLLKEAGVEVSVIEYLKTPPARAELQRLYARAGMTARDGLRTKEPLARELGLANAGEDAILDAMVAHPILIERPLVETEKGVRLGRPIEKVREIL
ncbi:arsenate reductase (glutaredoxin) [Sphingosinicella sp. LHD-64]|uniref:arsenate reductase (glutaredoxin) n=1 Tax=Sphingosinicella sp. LHD-64 TaxID=3072139 RepID=UPI0028105D99|nr:arsenate reductase (glutaredoxin) [Sphingosinicella sp. LHD-64]MDQ8755301.1 arsenate reductase (glutaredoxin) [Sphingosinicella sp. LHD-64]